MPFSNLNNSWSNLAQFYNDPANFKQTSKPSYPSIRYTSFDDGLIRGGVANAAIATLKDVGRVGKFFLSGKGILFSAKQFGLQMSNPRLESKIMTGVESYKPIGPTRIYNAGLNTLASVGGNAFGLHFDRTGLFPTIPDDEKYEAVAYYNNYTYRNDTATEYSTNRLVRLTSIINNNPFGVQDLDSYQGGAQSVYGAYPKTIINTTDVRTTDRTSKILAGATPTSKLSLRNTSLANQLSSSIDPYNKEIANKNIEKRLGVSTKRSVDSINIIKISDSKTFYGTSTSQANTPNSNDTAKKLLETNKPVDGYFARDIIKFRIEFLNNDNPVVDSSINTDVLAFRAYINDFNDGMNAKWNSYRYMGRGEEFYVYDGFTRDISVDFTVFAHSPDEMKPIYQKINYLMSSFAPDYSPNLKMRGNIGYLTVGDYIYRQPGVFTDIKISKMLDSHWEIDLDGSNQYEVPKHLNINLSFKPIHTFLPRKVQAGKYDRSPFITPDKITYGETGINNKYLSTPI